ncbi:MAG: hypothetical protein MMC33_008518 [Icmadophila ericetorum]|nr:hypothetical protein [Icmadophila ericetorum]
MKLNLILSLFAATALCVPSTEAPGLLSRYERRSSKARSNPMIPAGTPTKAEGPDPAAGEISANPTEYSSNWAGVVLTAPPAGSTFNSVVGTFTVPKPSVPSGSGSGTYSGTAWVGIDGDTYQNAILQSGVDWSVSSSGGYSYVAWYEWFPNPQVNFGSLSVTSGDVITVTVKSSSNKKGTATVENVTTGKSATTTVSAPCSTCTLGGQNAEWIVEDYSEGSSLVPFANFGTVTFTGASAGDSAGGSVGTSGGTILDIENSSGTVITSVTIPSNSEVQVKYV